MSKQEKREKKISKQQFHQALQKELKEHKSSFLVFYALRALAFVSLVRQIMLDNYEG